MNHAVRLGADDELVGVEVEHVSHLADDDTRRLARLDAEHRAVAVGDDGRQAPVVPLRRSQAVLLPCRSMTHAYYNDRNVTQHCKYTDTCTCYGIASCAVAKHVHML